MSVPPIAFAHELSFGRLPPEVARQARLWLLDLIGVAAGGSTLAMSRLIRDHAAAQFAAGGPGARMLLDGRHVSPAGAALAGGVTIDALDAHDGHRLTKGHAGCGALPAALAFAEAVGRRDGGDFLASLVLGYEIGTRAGIALHRTAADYHTSGAWIAIAAACLGARALGLDAARTREAIGIAEYHGPRSPMMRVVDHPTMIKDGSGWGAMAGVSAAYLASAGFTGAPAAIVESADVADLWSDLGARWRVMEQYFKPFPVCRWAQPPIQAVLALRAAHGLSSADVERIEVTTFHESRRLATRRPRTTEEAQYSTAFPVAAALVRGTVGVAEVTEPAFSDPEILRLSEGMTVEESDAYNAAFPDQRYAHVALVLRDGSRLVSERMTAAGDPENPASAETIRAKFHALADPVLGAARAAAIEQAVDRLGPGADLADLFALLHPPAGAEPLPESSPG